MVFEVSEKVGAPFVKETGCDVAHFVASGREDIDVRMLGSGRPFVLQVIVFSFFVQKFWDKIGCKYTDTHSFQLINPKKISSFKKHNLKITLKRLEDSINKNLDVKVLPGLKQITSDQASLIKNGQDGKPS